MAHSTTSWRDGQSGNPKGRPARPTMRTRPLATVLREIGAEQSAEHENRTAVASLIWQALRTGKLQLDSGNHLDLTAKEWLDLVKWVHLHVDGGLKQKEQSAEAHDQQSQLEELFADLDSDSDKLPNEEAASTMSEPATVPPTQP